MSEETSPEQISAVLTIINKFSDRLDVWTKEGKELVTLSKNLRKEYIKEHKQYTKPKKRTRQKNSSDAPRKPSGFGLPTAITPELADFLKLDHSDRIPRTKVTSLITEYVKEHKLQDEQNKKQINLHVPEAKDLNNLLKPDKYLPGKTVTFFNLQTLLKWHFPESKSVKDSLKNEESKKESELEPEKEPEKEPEPEPEPVPQKKNRRRVKVT